MMKKDIQVEWIHPSLRDLVIHELIDNTIMRQEFLKNCTLSGIKLALSKSGGAKGELSFPLLTNDTDWEILRNRILNLIEEFSELEIQQLLRILYDISYREITYPIYEIIIDIKKTFLESILQKILSLWNKRVSPLDLKSLELYFSLTLLLPVLLPAPNLITTWEHYYKEAFEEINRIDNAGQIEISGKISKFINLVVLIKNNEPRFLRQVNINEVEDKIINKYIKYCEIEVDTELIEDEEPSFFRAEIQRLQEIIMCLEYIYSYDTSYNNVKELISDLEFIIDEYEQKSYEYEPEYDEFYDYSNNDYFDISTIFDDL